MKLNYITIMVRDIEKSVKFYEELVGLHIVRRFHPGNGEIVFLQNEQDETMLELICFDDAKKVSVQGMVMSYHAGDLLETMRKRAIDLGYEASDIIIHPTKPKYFRVLDPDGITVEFSI